jgi:hypothetical protein
VPEAGVESLHAKIPKDSTRAFLDFASDDQKSRYMESFGEMENLCAFVCRHGNEIATRYWGLHESGGRDTFIWEKRSPGEAESLGQLVVATKSRKARAFSGTR